MNWKRKLKNWYTRVFLKPDIGLGGPVAYPYADYCKGVEFNDGDWWLILNTGTKITWSLEEFYRVKYGWSHSSCI